MCGVRLRARPEIFILGRDLVGAKLIRSLVSDVVRVRLSLKISF